jgi:hypothetical protein
MKLYTISGLGADERVFQNLSLNYEIVHLNWIAPNNGEALLDYAFRLSKKIDTSKEFGILGLSFGGLIAVEISKILYPKLTVLISSVEVSNELPLLYRIIGKIGFLKLIPSSLFILPTPIAMWIFGTKNKKLLASILKDADLNFYKWAINQLTTWKNSERIDCLKISGQKDKLLPAAVGSQSIVVKDGAHLMIIDKAEEVSDLINEYVKAKSI